MKLVSRISQRNIIIRFLKDLRIKDPYGGWVEYSDILGKNTPFGFVPVKADNRIRELVKEGVLESQHNDKFVKFRFALPKIAVKALDYTGVITAS